MKIKKFKVPNERATFAFSPDSRFLLLSGYTNGIAVLNVETGRKAFTFKGLDESKDWPQATCSPDGERVFAYQWVWCTRDMPHRAYIFDWRTRKIVQELVAHRKMSGTWRGCWSPEGDRFVLTAEDGKATVWSRDGKRLKTLKAKKEGIMSLGISPDGRFLALGCELGYINYFDFRTYDELFTIRYGMQDIRNVVFSADSRRLYVSCDNCLRIFDADSGVEQFILPSKCWCRVAASTDGSLIGCSHSGNPKVRLEQSVHIWDLDAGLCCATFPLRWGNKHFAFSPDGTHFAISHEGQVTFSPDGKMVACAFDDVEIWTCEELRNKGVETSQFSNGHAVIVSTDTRTGAQRAAEQAIKKPKFVSTVKGMPFPAHLTNCLVRVQSKCSATNCFGRLRCPCGEKSLNLSTTNEFYDSDGNRRPKEFKWNDSFFFIVEAACPGCATKYVLFDSNRHGWNGYLASEEKRPPMSPPLEEWKCSACSGLKHQATILVVGEPMRTTIEESGEALDESNWQEAFGAFNMAIECVTCGRKDPGWVSFESM